MPPTAKMNITAQDRLQANNFACFTHRERVAIADINNGYQLLNPIPNYKYRISDFSAIAIGGAAAGATAVVLNGVQSGATVALATMAVGGLTANTFLDFGNAGVAMLTGGASLAENDAGTAITLGKTGGALTGPTHIDVIVDYQMIQTRQGA